MDPAAAKEEAMDEVGTLTLAASSDQSESLESGYTLVGDRGHLIVTVWHGDSPERELLWAKRILDAVLATRQK